MDAALPAAPPLRLPGAPAQPCRSQWLCGADALAGLFRRLHALLPRRRHEPTGPLDVVVDLLLGLVVAKGASPDDIAAIPTATVAPASPLVAEKCAICLGPYETGDVVRKLACGHDFHAEVRTVLFLARGRAMSDANRDADAGDMQIMHTLTLCS